MKRFRVTTSRSELRDKVRNPFLVKYIMDLPSRTIFRTYEFEAEDEAECRRLFAEAQKERILEVIGFTVCKIEELPPLTSEAQTNCPHHLCTMEVDSKGREFCDQCQIETAQHLQELDDKHLPPP